MAITSYPFSSSPLTTEAQWALTASRWGNDGVHTDDLTSTTLKVTANGTSTLSIAAGSAFVNGATFENDAAYSLAVTSNSGGSSARKDLVVLRYDASADSIVPAYKTGGASAPGLTNSPGTGVVEIPLAECTVAAGASVVASGSVVDRRWGVGRPVAYGTPGARRPSRKGQVLVEGNDVYLGDGVGWNFLATAADPTYRAYTPTWSAGSTTINWGSGSSNLGRYQVIGKTCFLKIQLQVGGNPPGYTDPIGVSLPLACQNKVRELFHFSFSQASANGGLSALGTAMTYPTESTSKIARIRVPVSESASGLSGDINSRNVLTNSPFNIRTGDILTITGNYELA
ncbi:hypothetical protein OIE73_28655 [Streptomyces hirsutus]|uniref:Uncharacterized protein n=1 Tax=Streptomyces hirsutus TaxID=35620 RepID=A0ABZ1GV68_9ACTN|nr:hypothetical protein [Streptomyces hirsutus]WSD09318.1 hypothetical protein OIE73_28655 [Streptomyces hirsutus]